MIGFKTCLLTIDALTLQWFLMLLSRLNISCCCAISTDVLNSSSSWRSWASAADSFWGILTPMDCWTSKKKGNASLEKMTMALHKFVTVRSDNLRQILPSRGSNQMWNMLKDTRSHVVWYRLLGNVDWNVATNDSTGTLLSKGFFNLAWKTSISAIVRSPSCT